MGNAKGKGKGRGKAKGKGKGSLLFLSPPLTIKWVSPIVQYSPVGCHLNAEDVQQTLCTPQIPCLFWALSPRPRHRSAESVDVTCATQTAIGKPKWLPGSVSPSCEALNGVHCLSCTYLMLARAGGAALSAMQEGETSTLSLPADAETNTNTDTNTGRSKAGSIYLWMLNVVRDTVREHWGREMRSIPGWAE
jgi:hypothetical protein